MQNQNFARKNGLFCWLVAAILFIALIIMSGCDAGKWRVWGGVVANDVENRIDEILGKERVIREQAVQAIAAAKADVVRLQELVASSRVDAQMLTEKVAQLREAESASRAQLGKLAAMIEGNESVTLADGSVWEPADIEAYAETKIAAHQALVARISVLEESIQVHEETASRAQAALKLAQQNVAKMTSTLELLDAKIGLLQAVEAQPNAGVASAAEVTGLLDETGTLIDTLLEEVEREIRIAKERQALQAPPEVTLDAMDELTGGRDALVEQLYSLAGQQ